MNPSPQRRQPRLAVTASALLGLFLGLVSTAQARVEFERAEARDPSNQRKLYSEEHYLRYEAGELADRVVLYRCADGRAFARKQLDYRRSVQMPEFAFTDARSGFREGMRWRDGGPELWVQRPGASSEQRRGLRSQTRQVADAGFDEFIRLKWPKLLAGRSVPLSFMVPSRLQSYDFNLTRVGAATVKGEAGQTFRLKLGGVLGWVAPAVDVTYADEDQRLLRFIGLSNLRDDAGKSLLNAQIDFVKWEPSNEAALRQAQAQPLSACPVRPG